MSGHSDLALFYLARKAEGFAAFRNFAASYRENPAGCEHALVVIYKGFDDSEMGAARAEFADIPHREVRISDDGFDIGAYLQAAAQTNAEYACFINTHSRILSPSWLKHLHDAIIVPDVGLAGAFASYESLFDSLALINKAVWLAGVRRVSYDDQLFQHFRTVLELYAPNWPKMKSSLAKMSRERELRESGLTREERITLWQTIRRRYSEIRTAKSEEKWSAFWQKKLSADECNFLVGYPRFPNPHIRSNGFVIRRTLLLKLFPKVAPTKEAAYAFESGRDNLSVQVMRMGLRLALVDRYGRIYDPGQWPNSKTFRLGNQEDLMISDNQTRRFEEMSEPERATHVMMSWGHSACGRDKGYPLGFAFDADSVCKPAQHE